MPEILILADDLSGAADCAGGCAAVGLDTLVLLPARLQVDATATVLAIDLGSRDGPPDRAGRAITDAIGLARDDTKVIYHKIDSTLRGNWAHELDAARQAIAAATGAAPLAVIAPAFPERGRITREGRVLVRACGAAGAELTDAGGIALPLRPLGIGVRAHARVSAPLGRERLADQIGVAATSGVAALVCDAETEQDLGGIAAAGLAAGVSILWVGSAGLMRQLVGQLGYERRPRRGPGVVRGASLFVVGSAAVAAQAQFAALAAEPEIASLRLAAGDVQEPHLMAAQHRIAAHLGDAIRRGLDAAVLLAPGRAGSASLNPELVAGLARGVGPSLDGFAALVATGGETARCLLDQAGISGIRLAGEVEVGVPWGIGLGERTLAIITKAGAFGDRQTLVRCRAALKEIET